MRPLDQEVEEIPQINILPMIDVIFTILIFFIVSTLFLTRSQGLSVNLPKAETSQTQQREKINLTIEADGDIFLNRELVKFNGLEKELRGLVDPKTESLVILNADRESKHGIVIEVMDILRKIEGVKLAIASDKKEK